MIGFHQEGRFQALLVVLGIEVKSHHLRHHLRLGLLLSSLKFHF